ncbi:MAG: hypothetical protein KKB81_06535 [Candidatus Margulisbacteria bacterium]|nr:hypothetical protein [Candidatus Margulisiibacteriota bacterium]MBU1022453.1 hypothetical protein [Candidatus Margulisiibacteriota bacterium]MBU1728437.1 hypothetical protein [Candidatus Margulisiibacteriota bacterium]MBU1954584.1 hypothetical protein [Candidatus Margulisiibacteriota bacterium]
MAGATATRFVSAFAQRWTIKPRKMGPQFLIPTQHPILKNARHAERTLTRPERTRAIAPIREVLSIVPQRMALVDTVARELSTLNEAEAAMLVDVGFQFTIREIGNVHSDVVGIMARFLGEDSASPERVSYAEFYARKGRLLSLLGRREEAITAHKISLQIFAEGDLAKFGLAFDLCQVGKDAESRRYFAESSGARQHVVEPLEKALDKALSVIEAEADLGGGCTKQIMMILEQGEREMFARLGFEAQHGRPSRANVLRIANFLGPAGEEVTAERDVLADFYVSRARLMRARLSFREALEDFMHAFAINHNDGEAAADIAICHSMLGNHSLAVQYFEIAHQLGFEDSLTVRQVPMYESKSMALLRAEKLAEGEELAATELAVILEPAFAVGRAGNYRNYPFVSRLIARELIESGVSIRTAGEVFKVSEVSAEEREAWIKEVLLPLMPFFLFTRVVESKRTFAQFLGEIYEICGQRGVEIVFAEMQREATDVVVEEMCRRIKVAEGDAGSGMILEGVSQGEAAALLNPFLKLSSTSSEMPDAVKGFSDRILMQAIRAMINAGVSIETIRRYFIFGEESLADRLVPRTYFLEMSESLERGGISSLLDCYRLIATLRSKGVTHAETLSENLATLQRGIIQREAARGDRAALHAYVAECFAAGETGAEALASLVSVVTANEGESIEVAAGLVLPHAAYAVAVAIGSVKGEAEIVKMFDAAGNPQLGQRAAAGHIAYEALLEIEAGRKKPGKLQARFKHIGRKSDYDPVNKFLIARGKALRAEQKRQKELAAAIATAETNETVVTIESILDELDANLEKNYAQSAQALREKLETEPSADREKAYAAVSQRVSEILGSDLRGAVLFANAMFGCAEQLDAGLTRVFEEALSEERYPRMVMREIIKIKDDSSHVAGRLITRIPKNRVESLVRSRQIFTQQYSLSNSNRERNALFFDFFMLRMGSRPAVRKILDQAIEVRMPAISMRELFYIQLASHADNVSHVYGAALLRAILSVETGLVIAKLDLARQNNADGNLAEADRLISEILSTRDLPLAQRLDALNIRLMSMVKQCVTPDPVSLSYRAGDPVALSAIADRAFPVLQTIETAEGSGEIPAYAKTFYDTLFRNANNNMALIFNRAGRLAEARRHYERALEYDPLQVDLLVGLATVLCKLGKEGEAIKVCVQGVRGATQLHLQSSIYHRPGEVNKASLEPAAKMVTIYAPLAFMHYLLGDIDMAKTSIAIFSMAAQNEAALLGKAIDAKILVADGKIDKAQALIEEAFNDLRRNRTKYIGISGEMAVNFTEGIMLSARAEIDAVNRSIAEAENSYQRATAHFRSHTWNAMQEIHEIDTQVGLMKLQLKKAGLTQDVEAAVAACETGIAIGKELLARWPDLGMARRQMVRLLVAIGRCDEALDHMEVLAVEGGMSSYTVSSLMIASTSEEHRERARAIKASMIADNKDELFTLAKELIPPNLIENIPEDMLEA